MHRINSAGRLGGALGLCALGVVALIGCGGGSSVLPTPTNTPVATNTPGPTTTPTPISTGTATVFFASGNLVSGQFVQDGEGTFARYNIVTPTPEPTSTPGPSPTPEPTATLEIITRYIGTYTLSNGENGDFVIEDQPNDEDFADGTPVLAANKTLQSPPIARGTATISVQLDSGFTGSGSVHLSNGVTGTIKIFARETTTRGGLKHPRSLKSLMMH
ncbi:hypothetical protein IAD21_04541 [Abditibacteriota bacterium]|nr:hypothetical protein IAD21_04541 [Abditibacteriota bacterium]